MTRPLRPLAATLLALLVLAGPVCAADAPQPLAFAEFFVQPLGPHGLQPTQRLLSAVGQPVQLRGFIVKREQPQPGRFLLTPRPVTMAEHADGEADDLPAQTVTVLLPTSQRDRVVLAVPGPVTVTGRLEWGPEEDATGRVSWLRLRLDEDVLEPSPASRPVPLPADPHAH